MSESRRYVCHPDYENHYNPQNFRKSFNKKTYQQIKRKYDDCEKDVKVAVVDEDKKTKHKSSWGWLIWLIVLGLLAWWLLSWLKSKMGDKGRLVIAVDSAVPPRLTTRQRAANSLTKANVTIDHLQGYHATQGWVSLGGGSQTIDLLDLRNGANPQHTPRVILDSRVPVGQYSKLKFNITKVNLEDSQGSKAVITPATTYEMTANFNVSNRKDLATVIVLDIPLDEAIREAEDATNQLVKVFAPVIDIKTQDGSQIDTSGKRLTIQKPGKATYEGQVGTDIHGIVNRGLNIPQGVPLKVGRDGKLYIAQPQPQPQPLPPQPQPQPQPQPLPPPQNFIDRRPFLQQPPEVQIQPEAQEYQDMRFIPALFHNKPNRR